MTQAICEITTDEVNADVVVEPQVDTLVEVEPQADAMVQVANRAGGMEQVFHDNTLIGNGNSVDLGVNTEIIATKEYVDEKVALSIDTYTKDQIDGKLTAVDAQIDANADAIQKTREDYIQADSEIHQILNNHAENLTTLHNDLDDLGDQVAEIESKIPETASAENPLVTRSEISSVYKFKGSVATYNDLPTGATVGDVYNVTDTGANYAWDGSAWDKLSETVDLSSYATTAYVNAREQDIRDDYIQADSELQQQINAHATAITNLEDGVDSINGKIPTNASTTNLLVSTSQLNTEIQDVRADYMADDAALQTQINGQASTIAGIQDDITGINSKISTSASSTNKLVSASELSATEQDIRADMNEADSQLQTQITAQAGSITTLRNDTDDLGDQVAGIEGKIPAAASSSNQLALNSQITSLQTQITTNTNNFTNYRTSAAQDTIDADLQSQITAEQSARQGADTTLQNNITNGLALKLDKNQGSANQGKILSVGSDGQITLTAAPGGGLQAVSHNSTLTGAGTDASPLGIASSVLSELADKADQTVVDALASTVSSIQTDYTPKATTTALSNTVSGIQSDYVSKTAAAAQTIVSSLQMPELTVGTAEGTLNLSITAGVATIATNNGLDIISQTKFDTLPTTDDTTTWENALDANLVSKAQVASALSELPTGANLPILMSVWSDHLLNDMSWLRADTFSWHSGDVYKAVYEHLAEDVEVISYIVTSLNNAYYRTPSDDVVINGTQYYAWTTEFGGVLLTTSATPQTSDSLYNQDGTVSVVLIVNFVTYIKGAQTETIGDITISYGLADDGHKICLPDQESNIVALYEKTGSADYYILDTTNKQFKLPRKQKRTLIQAVKNTDGTWHNLYSDGWVEKGGQIIRGSITFEVPMADINYNVSGVQIRSGSTNGAYYNAFKFVNMTESGVDIDNAQSENPLISWKVCGYAAESAYASAGMQLEYYYVGNFEQSAIEQTAGITAETLNGKADTDLGNIPANYDYVVESQLPTADNGYTWYRLYKSGWLEAGGRLSGRAITFPQAFAVPPTVSTSSSDSATICAVTINVYNITTTGFSGHRTQIADTWHTWEVDMSGYWLAAGMSAQ